MNFRLSLFLLFIAVSGAVWAAPWNENIEVTVTDPNGVNTANHNFRWRVDSGAWTPVDPGFDQVTTLPYTFNALIDYGSVIEVEGYPCGSEFCASAVLTAYTVGPEHMPYSGIQITIPSPGP